MNSNLKINAYIYKLCTKKTFNKIKQAALNKKLFDKKRSTKLNNWTIV